MRTSGDALRILLLHLVAFAALSFSVEAQEKKPNILLITLDTFRADKLKAYGAEKDFAPALNAFAGESTVFVNAMTPSPVTLPAHATILTGCFPTRTALLDNGLGTLSPSVLTVAERLKEKGYTTRAIVSAAVLDGRYGLSRGFDKYDDGVGADGRRWGKEVTDPACDFLKEKKDRPFFLWVHYFDTHAPYFALLDGQPVFRDYDKAVGFVDNQVRRLLGAVPPDTVTIISSDHGEGLGDHGEPTHGILMFQPTMSVVLMIRGGGFGPSVEKNYRTLADITPTICRLAGVDPRGLDGLPLTTEGERVLPLSNLLVLNQYRWKPLFGASDGKFKWVIGDDAALYDLRKDPRETVDISALAPGEALRLRKAVPDYGTDFKGRGTGSFSGLGYLTGAPKDGTDIDRLNDPHKMLTVFGNILKIEMMREEMDWIGSLPLLRKSCSLDPGNPTLLFYFGDSLWRADNKNGEAALYVEKALEISPGLVPAWIAMGNIKASAGKTEEAEKCYRKAISLEVDSIEALNSLIALYLDMGKPDPALELLNGVFSRGLANEKTFFIRGRIHLLRGKADLARQDFDRAMELTADPKATLKAEADQYLLHGYRDNGTMYLRKGIDLYPRYAPNYLTLGSLNLSEKDYRAALICFEKALECPLSKEEMANVSEIVEGLKQAIGEKGNSGR